MPSRNVVKEFVPEAYYHVYNRGVEKRDVFIDDQDYVVFLGLLKKYLIGAPTTKTNRHVTKIFGGRLELLAYCLMPNHYHLLFYQADEHALSEFMRCLTTAYSMYFNNRYTRVGPLFQGTYKASHIFVDNYIQHITRYIHLNPNDFENWPYSSWNSYIGNKSTIWLSADRILDMFDDKQEYIKFVREYEATSNENDELKWQLANDLE